MLTNTDQWGNEFRIIVELPSWNLDIGNIEPVNGSGDKKNINSNSLVWWLLEIGFDLGRKHNAETIRAHIPEEFRESFDLGRGVKNAFQF